jgi:putative NIF3 family GTP cyclohydrolase 1 type 2
MIGRIGCLDCPCDFSEFVNKVKDDLGSPFVNVIDAQLDVSRVALCGGDGKDLLKAAFEAGADTYLTGTLSYNAMVDAAELPMNIIEAGHFHTENHVLYMLADLIEELDPDIETEIYESNPIRSI